MSNLQQDFANKCRLAVNKTQTRFNDTVADVPGSLLFKTEKIYAMHALLNNDLLARTAFSNPVSLEIAMAQVAASGLTLDPAMQLAYLVPRDGKVVAEISYRGLIDIALRSKAVSMVTVKAVYSLDLFRFKGDTTQPIHEYDPFMNVEDRGEFRGAYSSAYLANGMLLVTPVRAQDIYAARELSSAWKNAKPGKSKGPWESHFEAMALKTCVKISRKYWPLSSPILEQAIAYLNEEGGEGFTGGPFTVDMAANLSGGSGEVEQPGHSESGVVDGEIVDVAPVQTPVQEEAPVNRSQQEAPAQNDQSPQTRKGAATVTQLEPRNTPAEAGAGDSGASNLTEQMRERIDRVIERTRKNKHLGACEDWISNNLTGDCLAYGQQQLEELCVSLKQQALAG
ncbi:TPA: recombinase RecT [Pseudomonas aeruginosa]